MNSLASTDQTLRFIQLGEISEITMGQSPESETLNNNDEGVPFLQGCAEFGRRSPLTAVFCDPPLRVSKPGSILISVRAPVGALNWGDQRYCIGRGLAAIRAVEKIAETEFLFYVLSQYADYLHRRSQGSTFLAIGGNDLKSFPVPAFDVEKQQQIAHILQTIDQVIERTEALINKCQQIKAGLMHDLFTRGVGPDGQLRPPPDQAPELYQETQIGWVPNEWDVKPCSELCSRISVGIVIQPAGYYVESGVPAFRSANVRESGIHTSNLVYISEQSNSLLVKSQIKEGDILSVRTGYPGTSAVVPHEHEGANCIDVLISTPKEDILSDFLCAWINSSFGKGQVLKKQGGMAQQHFNVGEMRQLLTIVPSKLEQSEVSRRISSIDHRILSEKKLLAKLKSQKSGMMRDLLTGRK